MCWSSSSKSFPLNKFFEFVIRRQKPYRQYFYGEGYAQRRTQEIRRKREKRRKANPGRQPGREPAYAQHRRPGTQVHGRHRDDGVERGDRRPREGSGGRKTQGAGLLHGLHQGWHPRQVKTSGHVLVQRRARVRLGLDASGHARSAPGDTGGRWGTAPAALPVDRK